MIGKNSIKLKCNKCGKIVKIPKDVLAIDPCFCGGYFKIMKDRFKVGIHGLSEDMEDFMCEQCDYYYDLNFPFWTSFWKVCVDIWSEGRDLLHRQLELIEREYDKVKKERMK